MRIYIASKYIDHREINRRIYAALNAEGFDAFLPETINIDAITDAEMQSVGETCYNELSSCDVILVIAPIGLSVACEIAYAIALNREFKRKMKIIVYGEIQKREAMIQPYIDKSVSNVYELISYLHSI